MPQEVKKFQQFLECEAFFLVLSQLTGLKLHSMAPQDYEEEGEPGSEDKEPGTVVRNPLCRMEVQRWRRGCYTLTRDGCVDHRAALDAYLYTNTSEKWRHRMGDYVTYSTQEEDEEVLVPDNMPQEVKKFQQFLECEAFFLVLSQLTGLKLHSMAPQDYEEEGEPGSEDKEPGTVVRNPLCRMEVQRWRRGCYTLTRDGCVDHRAALDAYLYTNTSEKWRHRMGDYVTYSTQEEDEEGLDVMKAKRAGLSSDSFERLVFMKGNMNLLKMELSPETTE
ncbi:Prolyl 3-hydroxylase OGFOD1 [Chionoecetes opilio]|uniref:Prolyl 3-hydroxylase OGFOD1 n=1 Tax=Chionoecetes opilio TaxID=41210 RepID=A0A8J4Y5T3_CHIOP|nr:Prolyl 3-hydroxylase OGFOD1 [Chionoecetes opilio]